MQPVHVVHGQPVITKCIKCTACKSDQFSHNRHKQLVDCLRPLPPPLLDCDHLWPVGAFFNCWSLWRFQEQEFKVETILRLPVTRSAVETETLELAAVDGRGENSYEPQRCQTFFTARYRHISYHFISTIENLVKFQSHAAICRDMPRTGNVCASLLLRLRHLKSGKLLQPLGIRAFIFHSRPWSWKSWKHESKINPTNKS